MSNPLTMSVPTLILAAASTALVQAAAMYFIYRTRRTYPGFGTWTLTYLCHGVGLLLLLARGTVPDFLSVVVSNLMTSGAPLLAWIGTLQFFGHKRALWPHLVFLATLGLGLSYFYYLEPSLDWRVVLIALVMGGLCLGCAWDLWHLPGPDLRQASRFTAISLGIYGLLALSRGLTTLTGHALTAPLESSTYHGLFFLASVLVGVIPSYGMITMNAQRLEGELNQREAQVQATVRELTQALDEVHTLHDLLPICSSCKKIRDDRGYWQQVESYFASHSGVRFSHGVCPECLERLYPEVARKLAVQDQASVGQPAK